MKKLTLPVDESKIRDLKVGDMVLLTGTIYTGRDAVHKWLSEGNTPPMDLKNGMIYHCGPVVLRKKGKWVVTAAGPTTSIREEPYQAGVIERFGLRGIIGKGGMGEKTRQACEKFGCVYLHAVGGAAQVLAESVREVQDVFGIDEFGSPEAMWYLKVEDFPVVVTIDAHGNSLHKEVEAKSQEAASRLMATFKK